MCTQTFMFQMRMSHPSVIESRQLGKMIFPQKLHLRLSAGTIRNSLMIRCCASLTEQQEVKQDLEFDDRYYIRRCIDLAKKATGHTSPNPLVGCVILKDGKIVGEGYHPKAGEPHAEVFALRDAGDAAENGTVYVNLEPCSHYGRTPPCAEALIKAKVRKVVVGMVDPNPIVASTGVKKLEDAGIDVIVGVEEDLCRSLNEVFIHHILHRTPFVALRYSMSLDGYRLNYMSNEAAEFGGYYSKLLQQYDAVLLSSKALSSENSWPVSKEPGAKQPLKILLCDDHQGTPQSQIPALSSDEASNVTVISKKGEPQSGHPQIFETLSLDRLSLPEILEHCKSQGLCSVLVDLRGENVDFEDVLKQGFEEKLFQKVIVDVLPIIGDRQGNSSMLKFSANVKNLRSRTHGDSILLEGYL